MEKETVIENKIYEVAEFLAFLNVGLKAIKAKVIGEVTESKDWSSGFTYFTLKDEKNNAILSCSIWTSKCKIFGLNLAPGMKVIIYGNPEIYPPWGKLSFKCETIELAGEGQLKLQYDLLRKKLEKEGLFALENKREIPKYPQKIGLITSKQGAVIHDFLNNIGKFGFKISMIDSRVEGQGSVEDLLASIQTFRKKELDVLVIIRGGGSLESLQAFNNEILVREVAGFPCPVVVGIGHDQDAPLVCLAADSSQSTPTAVSNLLNESWEQALLFLERQERTILVTFQEILNDSKLLVAEAAEKAKHAGNVLSQKWQQVENEAKIAFEKFKNRMENVKISFATLFGKCSYNFNNAILRVNQNIKYAENAVAANDPERQLKLGYSIAMLNDKIIRSTGSIKIGDSLALKVSDGIIKTEVKQVKI